MRWMFGFQRRLVRLLTLRQIAFLPSRCTAWPNDGCFPQTSHTAAIGESTLAGPLHCERMATMTRLTASDLVATMNGFRDALRDGAGGVEFARAMTGAAEAAYGAVMRPVEGTILTVCREAAEAAAKCAGDGGDLLATIEAAKAGGDDALARTPDMLPVLKQA